MCVIKMFFKMTLCGQMQWDIITTQLYPTKPKAHLQFSTFLIILPVSALRIWGREKKTTSVARNISISEDISLPTKMPPWTSSSVLPKTKLHTDVWLSPKMFIKASYYNSEFSYRFKIPNLFQINSFSQGSFALSALNPIICPICIYPYANWSENHMRRLKCSIKGSGFSKDLEVLCSLALLSKVTPK